MKKEYRHIMNNRNVLRTVSLTALLFSCVMVKAQGVVVDGSVFGGGNEADVKGNTTVNIETGTVKTSVYGGGNKGSVGTFTTTASNHTHAADETCIGKPTTITAGGTCTVTISGGTIGPESMPVNWLTSYSGNDFENDRFIGHVFGASKGEVKDPAEDIDIDFRTYVNTTSVTISGQAFIKGSVYGGSQNGHVLSNSSVTIEGGQIGCGAGKTAAYSASTADWTVANASTFVECPRWEYSGDHNPYDKYADQDAVSGNADLNIGRKVATDGHTFYGNVFGGGSGYFPYAAGRWLRSAGVVEGSTSVTITGGHILTSVYGGNELTDVQGTCSVTMSGGTVGVPRTKDQLQAHPVISSVFGGGKGDERTFFNQWTNVGSTQVTIEGDARVFASVFGGGEDGHVLGNAVTTIRPRTTTTTVGSESTSVTTAPTIGSVGTSGVDGNVFGGGRGFAATALTAGVVCGNVTLDIQGGDILGSVYGGGRLASVGTYLVPPKQEDGTTDHPKYGELIPDNEEQTDGVVSPVSTHGHITVTVSGGSIGALDTDGKLAVSDYPIGDVYAGSKGSNISTIHEHASKLGLAKSTNLTISGSAAIHKSVYGGGEAGNVHEAVVVSIQGGTVDEDVYGGGALADTNTANWNADGNSWASGKSSATHTTDVELRGGTVGGDVYGGGLGLKPSGSEAGVEAFVYGDVTVVLNGTKEGTATTYTPLDYATRGCAVGGSIFGCNNANGTPKGNVTVHVFSTQHKDKDAVNGTVAQGDEEPDKDYLQRLIDIAKPGETVAAGVDATVITQALAKVDSGTDEEVSAAITAVTAELGKMYDVEAVYGGGNEADYEPANTLQTTNVIIEGCDYTSIKDVYGGGNAAAVPGTDVLILGDQIIDNVFGGGNGERGADYAAHVGFHRTSATTKSNYSSGSGQTNVRLVAGNIHNVYGGSNSNGDIRGGANTTMPSKDSFSSTYDCCDNLIAQNLFGGGKNADMTGGTSIVMGCMPNDWIEEVYAGSQEADVSGDVSLTITSGKFERVFGGNKTSGMLKGSITVNIEETGSCDTPIIIGELYGGGNEADYSVYGYDAGGNPMTAEDLKNSIRDAYQEENGSDISAEELETRFNAAKKNDPQLNVRAFTSIGAVYGGGYSARMYANPHVDINVVKGSRAGEALAAGNTPWLQLPYPAHVANAIGTVGNVFGGGNLAEVNGYTTVNIGTETSVGFVTEPVHLRTDPTTELTKTDGLYVVTAEGANITGNVYGGGNQAAVSDDTRVYICTTEGETSVTFDDEAAGVTIGGEVFGAGKGLASDPASALVKGNSFVYMGGGWVKECVYGGGELASVGDLTFSESSAKPTIAIDATTQKPTTGRTTVKVFAGKVGPASLTMPAFTGHVFGAGKGTILFDVLESAYAAATWAAMSEADKLAAMSKLNFVNTTDVTVSGTAFIKGSVYGGSEDGHVLDSTYVKIQGGQIGCGYDGSTSGAADLDRVYSSDEWTYDPTGSSPQSLFACNSWPYGRQDSGDTKMKYLPYDHYATETDDYARPQGSDGHTFYGNVFGGGSGYEPYKKDHWLESAGEVGGNTRVEITGGHVLTSVYGGNELTNVVGKCSVKMTGGTIGVPRTLQQILAHPVICNLFGAGKGDQRVNFNQWTNVGSVDVLVSGDARIYGSVFGGGEDGHVLGNVQVQVGKTGETNQPSIGTWGTSYVDGNVFGAGRGFGGDALTAGVVSGNVNLNIQGGEILGSVYGGGRLASVGTYLAPSTDNDHYGKFIPDGQEQVINSAAGTVTNQQASSVTHGEITITISGGTIGNDHEYVIPTASDRPAGITETDITSWSTDDWDLWKQYKNIPYTEFEYDRPSAIYRLKHTKGGNVFAGSMGRLFELDGETVLPHWAELGKAKSTKLTITGGIIKSNVYGGGELGKIEGYRTVKDSQNEDYQASTEIIINQTGAGSRIGYEVTDANQQVQYTFGSVFGGGYGSTIETFLSETEEAGSTAESDALRPKLHAGIVNYNTKVSLQGGLVLASVYGGGEVARVAGSTDVAVSGGTIGKDKVGTGNSTVYFGGMAMGNVYGGGKGEKNIVRSGQILTDTRVTISGTPTIYHNIYGGGAYGSVGDFTYSKVYDSSYKTWKVNGVSGCAENTGTARVTITGGTIGVDGHENGMVFGSSRGDVGAPDTRDDWLAWVNDTYVTIGTSGYSSGPQINGSVYGSGENGHTWDNAEVTLHSGTIGVASDASYANRGNLYGGGCGTDTYIDDSNEEAYNPLAGIVRGTTRVVVDGGQVVRNVYGAGAMGSVGNSEVATSGKTTIEISGGTIGVEGTDGVGNVYGAARGGLGVTTAASNLANVRETEVKIMPNTIDGKPEAKIMCCVYGGGEAGVVRENVKLEMTGGIVEHSVYGGGALADTQTSNWNSSTNGWSNTTSKSALHTTTVELTGGTVKENVYGGGLGRRASGNDNDVEAIVYGDVLLVLNGTKEGTATTYTPLANTARGCAVDNYIFGCNNENGTPKGDVTVQVYGTQNSVAEQIGNPAPGTSTIEAGKMPKVQGRYDVKAVYGGGNLAAYIPADPEQSKVQVIIDGCELTSIETVYGGGNAAPVPESNVDIKGTYEIGYVFGGGNGKDDLPDGSPNPGADIGQYSDGTTMVTYGTGDANTLLEGGLIHEAYGGSNQKGDIKGNINQQSEPVGECELILSKVVGAGKYADIDGDVNMLLSCQPEHKIDVLFAGADEANVNGNITLTITNGSFGQVFGGNNLGGVIKGRIVVNVEETGCRPINIDELYLGGNNAAYSVFGYYESNETHAVTGEKILLPRLSADDSHTAVENPETDATHSFPYAQPELNIISCTRIGAVFGGGYGPRATMYANPTLNINMAPGRWAEQITPTATNPYRLGEIVTVFGGGNAAEVVGNPTVNIGTRVGQTVHLLSVPDDENTEEDESARTVVGANITGSVFGGGNKAKVVGDTKVNIGENSGN